MSLSVLKSFFKSVSPITLSLGTSLLVIAVSWGMQIARIELLEKELYQIRSELGSHEKVEREDDMIEKLEHRLAELIQSLNHLEQRISRR